MPNKKLIKLSDYIADRLNSVYGVKDVFLISGGGAMHLNNAFGSCKIKYYTNHNEQACAIAAEGYARMRQKMAVVNVTTGPGGLNCLNGVFGQWTDSVPVLYISGQVKFETTLASCPKLPLRQLGDQEVDIISVVKPLTKYAVMVTDPNTIKYHLDRAIYLATNGRMGPVWLDIPMNVQAAMIDPEKLKKYNEKEDVLKLPSFEKQMQQAISKLKSAKRPLIVAGHGIRLSKTENIFRKLLKKINIPVTTTLNGADLLENKNKNFIGRIGTIGQRAGNFALQNADVILFLGTRNNIRQSSYNWENYGKNAYKIVVDIDKAELLKPTVKPDMAINADLADFMPKLLTSAEKIEKTQWLSHCQNLKDKYSFYKTADYKFKTKKIHPYFFVRKLSEQLEASAPIVTTNASSCVLMFQTGEIKKNQRVIWNSGDASMGYDLPAAIGACIANGKKETICLAGDGSIMMNLQELQTIKEYTLPIKVFILNNSGYVSIRQTQKNFFNGHLTGACPLSGVSTPDFCETAKAFGLKTMRIKNSNFEKDIKKAMLVKGPLIVDVQVEKDYIFLPKLSAKKLDDGTMVSPSLEDMYPFLSREEFNKNIIK